MPTLSKIESKCPNIQVWYALAKASPSYGDKIVNDTSLITELGTIMGNYINNKQINLI